ncbi:MAG: hypothetical protein O2897_05140, partial [bacterium]|nr:hypothetical protein [bacterium]
ERFKASNIVAGMSGSPLFINKKLIGALSYGIGAFMTEGAMAGVTPIDSMLSAVKFKNNNNDSEVVIQKNQNILSYKPIALSLVSSGVSQTVLEHYKPLLEKNGDRILASGGSSEGLQGKNKFSSKLYPGGPVAAVLIDGPISLAAIGTVTWVNGKHFLGFGHPFLQTGFSQIPIATAEIVTTVFSQNSAFKIGQMLEIVGTMTDDRKVAIGGILEEMPSMMDFVISINKQKWNYRIGRYSAEAALYAAMALGQALTQRSEKEQGGFYNMNIAVELLSGEQIKFSRQVSGADVPLELKLSDLFMKSVTSLVRQPFREIEIKRIRVDVMYKKKVEIAQLLNANMGGKFKAGSTENIFLSYKNFNQAATDKKIAIAIPKGLEPGSYQFIIADRENALKFEQSTGRGTSPTSYSMLLAKIKLEPSDTEACIYLQQNFMSKRLNGFSMVDLPYSLQQITAQIAAPVDAELVKRAFKIACIDLGKIVSGSLFNNVQIYVEEKT